MSSQIQTTMQTICVVVVSERSWHEKENSPYCQIFTITFLLLQTFTESKSH